VSDDSSIAAHDISSDPESGPRPISFHGFSAADRRAGAARLTYPDCDASVNSANSPVTTNTICSAISTRLLPPLQRIVPVPRQRARHASTSAPMPRIREAISGPSRVPSEPHRSGHTVYSGR